MFSEWFPQSGYVPEGAQIEWYGEGDVKRSDYRSEIWIAVKKSVRCIAPCPIVREVGEMETVVAQAKRIISVAGMIHRAETIVLVNRRYS